MNEWGGKILFAHGSSASKGIAICVKKQIFGNIKNVLTDIEGRYIIFDIEENSKIVTLVAIYAPNEDKPQFFQEITKLMRDRQENKIIVGDFNLTLNIELDRKNTYCNNNKAKEEVENIMDEFHLKDVWRIRNEEVREYSWFKKGTCGRDRKASRIDFTLASAGLDQDIQNIMYLSSIMTDHRAIYFVLDLTKQERGTGYWKLNNTLLQNELVLKSIEINRDFYRTWCDLGIIHRYRNRSHMTTFNRMRAGKT